MVIYGNNSSMDSLPYIVKKSMEEIFPWKRISIEEEDNKRAFPYSVKINIGNIPTEVSW